MRGPVAGRPAGIGGSRVYAALSKAPVFFAGLVADFNAANVAGVADGAAVSSWSSSVGSYVATVPSGGAAPTFAATGWSDGGPALRFVNASHQCLSVDALAALAGNGAAFTVALLVRRVGTGNQILWGMSNGASVYRFADILQAATKVGFWNNSGGALSMSPTTTQVWVDSLLVWVSDGASSAIYLDGVKVTGALNDSAGVTYSRFVIGTFAWSGGLHPTGYTGLVRRAMVWNRALGNADLAALRVAVAGWPAPADANGLVFDLDAAAISGVTDGAAVARVVPRVGAIVPGQSSSGNRPTFAATGWSDGGAALRFAKASAQHLVADQLASIATDGVFTVAAVLRPAAGTALAPGENSNANDRIIAGISDGSGSSTYHFFDVMVASKVASQVEAHPGQSNSIAGGLVVPGGDALVVFVSNGAGASSVWVNGRKVAGTLVGGATAISPQKFLLGGLWYNGSLHPATWDGDLRRLRAWDRALSDAEVQALGAPTDLGGLVRGAFDVVALGDSMTVPSSWASLYTKPSGNAGATVYAQSGRTLVPVGASTSDVLANLAGAQGTYTRLQRQVIVIFAGGNDVYYGADGNAALAHLATVIAAIRATNPYDWIVVAVPPDRGGWSSSPVWASMGGDAWFNANMATLRAGITSGAYGDAVWNLYTMFPDCTVFSDLVHPNGTQQQTIANDFAARLPAWATAAWAR